MSGSRIRADFDALDKVAKIFTRQAQASRQMLGKINHQMSILQGGDWVGRGANQFYRDMEDVLLPALKRLADALEHGGTAMGKAASIMHQANEDLAGLYRGSPDVPAILIGLEAAAGAIGVMGSGAEGGAGGAAGAGAGAGAGASPAWQVANPLLARDPSEIFGDANLKNLIDVEIKGAGSQLGGLMTSLGQNPSGNDVQSILIQISNLRGRPVVEIQIEFGKFQDLQAQQQAVASAAGAAAAGGAAAQAAGGGGGAGQGFQGSMTQMRYGKLVGDAFGVDPVFGAMLNPKGGLIGPGNYAVAGGNSPVGYHAVAHAAAGYLLTNHNVGPGFSYAGSSAGAASGPQAGHLGGISYWRGATGGSSSVGASSQWLVGNVTGKVDMASSLISNVKSVF